MNVRHALKHAFARLVMLAILPATIAGFGSVGAAAAKPVAADSGCQLRSANGSVKHVIYVQFDNTHFARERVAPDVPSDLEQMPNLLSFLKGNGTLDTNHHTPLISHTATDILTSLTGLYGDRHGVPVSNSFKYFTPTGKARTGVSFAYWTAPIFDPGASATNPATDTTTNMLTADGKNAPAPWVPFTRAGCNVGSVATANTVLENTAIDIPTVFGAGSSQANEVAANPGQAFADFVGIGVHCASGNALCSSANGGKADKLPQEPGGYNGYSGLFGHKYVAPQLSPGAPLTDLNGNVIRDSKGHIGFPGFDGMSAAVSLSYVAALQEHGVPVTYAYISDAHDNHAGAGAYGPGEAGYVAALKAYDDAFGKFFTRLAADGINKENTLFVFTSDEGDHFGGGSPTPAGCDGVNTPCEYSHVRCVATSPASCPPNNVGETNGNLAGLLASQKSITTRFTVHSDDAPTVYIIGNPAPTDSVTRALERAAGGLTGINPQTGSSEVIMQRMADPVEMKLLHMVTADPARTPTFTYFANPEYFLFAGAPNCNSPCLTQEPGFAWNHGDFQPEISTTWLGMVGPGVRNLGATDAIWSDHTDIRPTILAAVGLHDDYAHQGRVLFEALNDASVPVSLRQHRGTMQDLAQAYKQINAPVGELGLSTLRASTKALQGNDTTYASIESQLTGLTGRRDALAADIIGALEAAAFEGTTVNENQAKAWIAQAKTLIDQANALAAS
ncbi:MAG: hypothetical protein PVSMB9_02480 [Candidatus Dormibacteria bacterium]